MSETKRKWCAALAILTAPMQAPQATAAFVAMLTMLPTDDSAYNRTTLELAAKRDVGDTAIPNFDKINRAFAQWQRENLPAHIRLGGSPSVPMIENAPRTPLQAEIDHVAGCLSRIRADASQRASDAAIEAPKAVRPAYLTGAALKAMREAVGIKTR